MLSEKLKTAIDFSLMDKVISKEEFKKIYKIADEEGVPHDEVKNYIEKLKLKCPECLRTRNKKGLRCEHCKYIFNPTYRRLFHLTEIATPIIHFIGLIALVIAAYELWEVKRLAKTTNMLARKTDTVQSQMRTVHLDDFPKNLPHLTSLIKKSKTSLDIVCDVPAYGIFSSPQESILYQNAILEKITDPSFKFNLIIFKDSVRKEAFIRQFKFKNFNPESAPDFKLFLRTKEGEEFRGKLDNWISFCNNPSLSDNLTMNKLYETVNDKHLEFIKKVEALKKGSYHQVSCELTSYFWISDNEQIAFSFVSLGKLVNECTFKSTDLDLIRTMDSTILHLKKEE